MPYGNCGSASGAQELLANFGGLVLRSQSQCYIGRGSAEEFIELCRQANVVIVIPGMEGVATGGEFIRRDLDHIANFSDSTGDWAARIEASYDAALRKVRASATGVRALYRVRNVERTSNEPLRDR